MGNEIYPRSPYSLQHIAQQEQIAGQVEGLVRDDLLDRPYVSFSDWLSGMQKARKLSLRGIAQLSGVDHSTLSRILASRKSPFTSTAVKLTKAFELDAPGFYGLLRNSIPLNQRYELTQRYAKRSQVVMNESFGRQIEIYREDLDFTQRRLASESGVDHSTLSRMESGILTDPIFSTFVKLSHALALNQDQALNLADSALSRR